MSIHRIIYVSRVARHVRFADAEDIAERASANNRRHGLTGLLLYSPSHFIQVLEGAETDVIGTVERIRHDPRHSELRVIDARDVADREFSAWSMVARRLRDLETVDFSTLTADPALQLLRRAREVSPA